MRFHKIDDFSSQEGHTELITQPYGVIFHDGDSGIRVEGVFRRTWGAKGAFRQKRVKILLKFHN